MLEVLASIGVRTRWLPDEQRPRDHPAGGARPRRHRRRRGATYPHGHHVPRPAAARARDASSCRTPAAATSAPAPSSRTWRRCARSGSRSRPPTASTTRASDRSVEPAAADRAHRARRHRHRERPHGGRPPPGHDGHPQRVPQLHGPGPLLLPAEARRPHRGHRHDDPDRHGVADIDVDVEYSPSEDPIEAMCLLAAASSPTARSRSAGCRSSSSRSSSPPSTTWA